MNSKKLSGRGLVIQLSSDKIRIAKTRLGAAIPQLEASFVADLPEGAVVDGVIHNLEAVREVLKGALATPDFRRVKKVVFALCTTQVIAEEATMPPMAVNKLDKMLEANMDMYFPVDTQNYHLTWQLVDKANDKGEMVIQLWAVSTSIVQPYYVLANSCGLSVMAIDYCGHALASAVDVSFSAPAGGKKRSAAALLNKPLFKKKEENSDEEMKGAAVAVSDSPAPETELYLMAENEHLLMLFAQDGQVKLQRMALCGYNANMETELGEVVMALDYFENMNPARFGDVRCILCGALAEDDSFVALTREVLNIPVQVLPALQTSDWTLCLGAARTTLDFGVPELNHPGGVGQINNAWQYGLILVGGAALVLSLATTFGSKSLWTTTVNGLESQKQTLQIQAAQNANYAQNYYNYQSAYQNYSADWDNLFGSLRTYNDNLVLMIDELEDTLPKETSVVGIQIADQGLSLELAAPTKEEAAYTIIALRGLQYADLLDISDLVKPSFEQAPTVGSNGIDFAAMMKLATRIQNGEDPAKVIGEGIEDGTINDETLGMLLESKYVNNETAKKLIDEGIITEERLQELVDNGIIDKEFKDDILNGTLDNSGSDTETPDLEDILGDILGDEELSKETLMEALQNMTPEQLDQLEETYAPVPTVLNDLNKLLETATLKNRQDALTDLIVNDPIGMYRFFKLLEIDMGRDLGDNVLHEDIYADLYNDLMSTDSAFAPLLSGDMEQLPTVMPELVKILSKDDTRMDTVERLISEDKKLQKRYTYYLAVQMGVLENAKPDAPVIDPDDVFDDLLNGDINGSLGDLFEDLLNPDKDKDKDKDKENQKDPSDMTYDELKDQIMQDILDEMLNGGDLSDLLGGKDDDESSIPSIPGLDDWSDWFPGGLGNLGGMTGGTQYPTQQVDERYHFTVVLGYKPELIAAERERKGLDYDAKITELEVAE